MPSINQSEKLNMIFIRTVKYNYAETFTKGHENKEAQEFGSMFFIAKIFKVTYRISNS